MDCEEGLRGSMSDGKSLEKSRAVGLLRVDDSTSIIRIVNANMRWRRDYHLLLAWIELLLGLFRS